MPSDRPGPRARSGRWLAPIALAACSGGAGATRALPPPEDAAPPAIDAAPSIDATPPISEAAARALLADRFRAAGFRIRFDVRVDVGDGVTLDGFDPEREVGYEYVAVEERGTDLSDAERAQLASWRVLVIDAADEATVAAAADTFLDQLPAE